MPDFEDLDGTFIPSNSSKASLGNSFLANPNFY